LCFILFSPIKQLETRHHLGNACTYLQLNAYQTGDDIVIDLIAYDDTRFLDAARLPALREPTGFGNVRAQVRRYTLRDVPSSSLSSSSTRSSTSGLQAAAEVKNLCQQQPMYELPSINPKNLMKPYRYAYAICHTMEDVKFPDSLAKIDVQSGAAAVWSEEDCYPGEPIFVATPGSNKDEDDGVLLSVVGSISRGRSFLLVLDAKTMNEIARAWAPQLVSYGFHGRYEHRQ
jgi:carotenoid cleavage dioxygenase-like enzyme